MPVLAGQFLVIAPDLRGAGGSSKPRNASYRKRDLAKDVYSLIHQLIGDRPVNMCGYDHGAGTAYQYAAQWPHEVARLAFLELPLPGFGYEELMQPGRGWDHVWQPAAFTVPDVCERFFV